MKIWVDADACPVVVKEILFRAADRTGVQLTLVANQALNTPSASNINTIQVPHGFDVADDEIVKRVEAGDLVITSDIPLAAEVIEKGAHALSPRGEMHTKENIGARLNMRDFLDTMRSSGVEMSGGPAAFSQRDKQEFANNLDRFLTKFAMPAVRCYLSYCGVGSKSTVVNFIRDDRRRQDHRQARSPFRCR